jgi:uncharacterized lipoprotein
MRIVRTFLAIVAVATLAACVSPQEQAARTAAERQADAAECKEIGFTEGTEAFADCMLRLKEIRAEKEHTEALRRAQTPSPWWGPYPGYPYRYYPPYYR